MKMTRLPPRRIIFTFAIFMLVLFLTLGARFHLQERYSQAFWTFLAAFAFSAFAAYYFIRNVALIRYYVVALHPMMNLPPKGIQASKSCIKAFAWYSGSLKQCCNYLNTHGHKTNLIIMDSSGNIAGRRIGGRWLPLLNNSTAIKKQHSISSEVQQARATKTLTIID